MAKKKITNTAALSEGGTAADGSFLVPQETSTTIANLAMEEVSARKLSRCIVTEMDLKLPYQASRSVVTAKAESTDQGSTAFGVSVPTFATTTLSAFMHGQQVSVSWELQQDVAALSSFLTDEFNRSTTTYEESVFVNGSGSGEPEGYLTGATAFETVALSSDSILDLIASVRKDYFAGSSFLLSRSEFHRLYKAQIAADQFQQFVTYDANGAAKLLGFPVFFSSEMPTYVASPSTNGAVLFGNFRAGFCLGDRGDSSIHVKILDQVSAVNGQTVYVCWRRSDQRCVLAEAVSLLTTNG
jgi:HK97 family phage major capsid protein